MEKRKELKLGRGHESDIRIADVSISRYHATIRFVDGKSMMALANLIFSFPSVTFKCPVVLVLPRTFCVGEYVLEDNNSKFGTLVSLRKSQTVEATRKELFVFVLELVAYFGFLP